MRWAILTVLALSRVRRLATSSTRQTFARSLTTFALRALPAFARYLRNSTAVTSSLREAENGIQLQLFSHAEHSLAAVDPICCAERGSVGSPPSHRRGWGLFCRRFQKALKPSAYARLTAAVSLTINFSTTGSLLAVRSFVCSLRTPAMLPLTINKSFNDWRRAVFRNGPAHAHGRRRV